MNNREYLRVRIPELSVLYNELPAGSSPPFFLGFGERKEPPAERDVLVEDPALAAVMESLAKLESKVDRILGYLERQGALKPAYAHQGQVLDISGGGLSFATLSLHPVGAYVELCLIPQVGDPRPIYAIGKICWVEPATGKGRIRSPPRGRQICGNRGAGPPGHYPFGIPAAAQGKGRPHRGSRLEAGDQRTRVGGRRSVPEERLKRDALMTLHMKPAIIDCPLDVLAELDRPAHMGRLLRGLIHNINGPLQNISMLLELMERNHAKIEGHLQSETAAAARDALRPLCDGQKGRIQRILDQVRVFSEMLKDFMVLQEIESNESEVEINVILEKLSRAYRADLFFKHHVTVTLRPAAKVPLLRVRGRHLIPALEHLVENAVLSMRASKEKNLVLSSEVTEEHVIVEVRDTGCGLPKDRSLEELFEPFVTAWPDDIRSADKTARHMGLGLTLARKLLEPYGAAIALKPGESGGTTARVVLPKSGTFFP